MAAKRSSKSSKTEHVLNLLSGTAQPDTTEQSSQESALATAATTQKKVTVPVLEVARANHDNVADKITSALDEAFAVEVSGANNDAEDDDSKDIQDDTSASPKLAQAINSALTQEVKSKDAKDETVEDNGQKAESENDTKADETKEESPQVTTSENSEDDKHALETAELESAEIVNVMEEIVDSMIEKYAQMFDVCKCPRCKADVKAYALTKLPSKYVVLTKSTRSPMMHYYSARFETQIKNQIIVACNLIKDHPRHTAEFRKNY